MISVVVPGRQFSPKDPESQQLGMLEIPPIKKSDELGMVTMAVNPTHCPHRECQ